MVSGEENKGQIDGRRADLHSDGVREVAGGGFRIGLARECGGELKSGRNWGACGKSHHGMNVSPVVCRDVSRMLKKSSLLDPGVHPFRAVLGQLVIEAPHVGMEVVELRQEIV